MDRSTAAPDEGREAKYAKAKADALNARKSFGALDADQKERLLNEFLPKRYVYLAKLLLPSLLD